MRIILLTILFVTSFYYFRGTSETKEISEIDSIKLKMGAPDRFVVEESRPTERLLTVEEPVTRGPAVDEGLELPDEEYSEDPQVNGIVSDLEHVEEVELQDVEEGWNTELKGMLSRLEPMDGEAIHNTYLQAQESYQAELNALMDEKQQKETEEEALEIEQLIGQLDYNHQERLKEILGAHYEAVRDHYQYYMDSLPPDQ